MPHLHAADSGIDVPVGHLARLLMEPVTPRDGVSVLGGEPFAQPDGLASLVVALRAHVVVYSGYTYERLRRMARREPAIGAVLDGANGADVLIDGPYVAALAPGAGPWTGSANQRVIDLAATRRRGRITLLAS